MYMSILNIIDLFLFNLLPPSMNVPSTPKTPSSHNKFISSSFISSPMVFTHSFITEKGIIDVSLPGSPVSPFRGHKHSMT
jgi:hypothetical protein